MEKMNRPVWLKFRHKIIKAIIRPPFTLAARIMYGFKAKPIPDSGKRQYMIIMNHQTPFDQFFAGIMFKGPVYYVATEDIFSIGWLGRLLEYAVAPIPIKKSTQDINSIRNIMQVVKEGGTVCIFPEGNRTYSGVTENMKPAIAKLIRMAGLPIAVLNLNGGYGSEPRWSTKRRKGKLTCTLKTILEPEDYKKLSNEEFYKTITSALYVDDPASGEIYKSKKRAEFIERALYVCPECGLSRFISDGNSFECKKCGLTVEYEENLTLKAVKGKLPFTTTKQWYDAQEKFITELNPDDYINTPVYSEPVSLYKVRVYKSKKLVSPNCLFDLYGDRYIIHTGDSETPDIILSFDEIKAVSVLGRNKLNIYYKDDVFQIKADERFNSLKYMHFYFHYKNIKSVMDYKGDGNEFLGL